MEGRGWSPTPAAPCLAVAEEYSQKLSSPARSLALSHTVAAPNSVSTPSQGEPPARGKPAWLQRVGFGEQEDQRLVLLLLLLRYFPRPKRLGHPLGSLSFWLNSPFPSSPFLQTNTTQQKKKTLPKKVFTDSSCVRKKISSFLFLSPNPSSIKQISASY